MYISSTDIQSSVSTNTQNTKQTSETQEKHLEESRQQVFFNPIILQNTRIDNYDISSNTNIKNNSFLNNVSNANCVKLKKIFSTTLDEFIELTKYFCQDRHVPALKKLISRIKNEPIQDNINYLKNNFSSCIYQIHDLIILLKNFKYQLEQQNAVSTHMDISKDTIALRLDECIVDLNKCWAGIYSRLANEYEILSSLNQGITGEINLVKKELFDAILRDYLTEKKQKDKHLFIVGNEIHIRNALHNLMQQVLGIHKIEDPLEDNSLPDSIKEEFIELIKIEISPAKITSILVNKIYQQFTEALADISMTSWLTEYKTDEQLIVNLETLDTKFFIPINTLFNVAEADKLCMSNLIDTKKEEYGKYYLICIKEKIHQWIANRLMPNTQKVFVTTNNLTINTIDYMFFWEYKQGMHDFDNDDSNDYIKLQLFHIQNLDFINFTDVDLENHSYLSDHIKKTTVSIVLVTQAMEQTNNIDVIIDFFTDAYVYNQLNNLSLLKNKLYNILNDKLTDINFRKQFSNAIIKLITIKNYNADMEEIFFLVNNCICVDVLTAMTEQNLCINNLIVNINIKYLDEVTIESLSTLTDTTKELLFSRAFNNNSCKFIYKLLTILDSNKYTKYNNIASNETLFALAIEYNHPKLVELLLQDKNLNIENYSLHNSFYDGNDKIIYLCIKHILTNKDKFSIDIFINNIQAKNNAGSPGLYAALVKGHHTTVKEYINLILDNDGLTKEQKFNLIQAKNNKDILGLSVALFLGHHTVVNEYINLILTSDEFTKEQKLDLIQAKNKNGFPGLLTAVENGQTTAVKEYINLVLTNDMLDIKQKQQIMEINHKLIISSISVALKNGYNNICEEYIKDILYEQQLELKYREKLINKISKKHPELYEVIINNSSLTNKDKRNLFKKSNYCVIS